MANRMESERTVIVESPRVGEPKRRHITDATLRGLIAVNVRIGQEFRVKGQSRKGANAYSRKQQKGHSTFPRVLEASAAGVAEGMGGW
jgi:hypothetical protein